MTSNQSVAPYVYLNLLWLVNGAGTPITIPESLYNVGGGYNGANSFANRELVTNSFIRNFSANDTLGIGIYNPVTSNTIITIPGSNTIAPLNAKTSIASLTI